MTRSLQRFAVFAFESTHAALDAEDALKSASVLVVPIPTPGSLGGLCGLAMRVPLDQADLARDVLTNRGMEPRAESVIDDF